MSISIILNEIFFPADKISLISKILNKKRFYDDFRKIKDPNTIYWIPPERIIYSTSPQKEGKEKKPPLTKVRFDERMRGKTLNVDWDKTKCRFIDSLTYKIVKQTIESDEELRNAAFFRQLQKQAMSPTTFWSNTNAENFLKLIKYFGSKLLINVNKTRKLDIHFKNSYDNAVEVNIGRNGEYLFQDNAFTLAVTKVLKVASIPVRVFVRHEQWEVLRESILNFGYQDTNLKGFFFQPIVHPDFAYFSTMQNKCQETMDSIKPHLTKKNGRMLDIGANLGFFCHKFEDLGYRCCAVENEINTFRIMVRIRDAENKKFTAINKSIFDADSLKNKQFDVVLALNILHHFLKEKTLFNHLKEFLQNLETDMIFFSAADYRDEQMKNAYQNYSESEFVEFILKQTSLNMSEVIGTGRLNRPIYKLSR